MSRIAARAGVAEVRLYRYFSDLDAVTRAWHDRQIANHLAYLDDVGNEAAAVIQRLDAVFRAYAAIVQQTHQYHTTELGASLHRTEGLVHARRHLHDVIRNLLVEGVKCGEIRDDIAPDELADYCLHALSSAGGHTSTVAIRQLVAATLSRLRRYQPPGNTEL
jgi:AcrR family transcriptional regulator